MTMTPRKKKLYIKLVTITLSLIALTISLPGYSQAEDKTFVFTAIPDQDQSKLIERFKKMEVYLAKHLNVPVKYVPVKSYAAAIAVFQRNDVQLAWFGGLSGVRARILVPGSEVIAQGYEDQFFKTYLIANAKSSLKTSKQLPSDIKGMTFTFGSKGSTSGRLMPEYYLSKHFGQEPSAIFQKVGFSGNHSRTISLVESGAYQIGAVNYQVYDNAVKSGLINPEEVVKIWETPTYPDYQWTVRGDLDKGWGKGFTDKVKRTILDIKDKDVLAAFPRSSFVPAKNSDYQPIEDTAKLIGLLE